MKKMGLNSYKRQRAPKYNQQQLEKMSGQCRKVVNKKKQSLFSTKKNVLQCSGDSIPANARFYSSNKTNAPNDVKFKQKQKFKSKVLLWLILPSESVSQPYIGTTKGVAINTNVYVQKYLSKLLPFIKTHHQHDEYNFWSGFTSSHYANITID